MMEGAQTLSATALPGLPPYGPPALSFPQAETGREGFVVEFTTSRAGTWIGNFARRGGDGDAIHDELGAKAILVVAGGAGYLVDAEERRLVRQVGGDLQNVIFHADSRAIIVSDGLRFEAFYADRTLWRSRRVSWDGMRGLRVDGARLFGEAYDPMTDEWLGFELDLDTGIAAGGSYRDDAAPNPRGSD